MNIFHPGFLFKQSYATLKAEAATHNSTDEEQVQVESIREEPKA
jgi:hypothetical protein